MAYELLEKAVRAKPEVAASLFGSSDPQVAIDLVDGFMQASHGTVRSCDFFELSIGAVGGFELAGGAKVIMKALSADRVNVRHLQATREITAEVAAAGVPAPLPLAGPVQVGGLLFTTDSFLAPTPAVSRHDLAACKAMAEALGDIVKIATPMQSAKHLLGEPGLGPDDALWNKPHSVEFDFEKAAGQSKWIDNLAAEAKELAAQAFPSCRTVVGHLDFSYQNVRLRPDATIAAIYDWDSLYRVPEPVVVGSAAVHFTYTHDGGNEQYPSADEAASFVRFYEARRDMAFTANELQAVSAAGTYTLAYVARCDQSGPAVGNPGGCRQILRDYGSGFLRFDDRNPTMDFEM